MDKLVICATDKKEVGNIFPLEDYVPKETYRALEQYFNTQEPLFISVSALDLILEEANKDGNV